MCLYFIALGFPLSGMITGCLLLAWGMCQAFNQSDLSFYSYSELLFFLLAGACMARRWLWMMPILLLVAAANRESSIMLLALFGAAIPTMGFRRIVWPLLVSMVVFVAVQALAHWWAGPSPLYSGSCYGAVYPGVKLAMLNFTNKYTWYWLIRMYAVLPLVLLWYRQWPISLRWHFWMLAIPWCFAQFLCGSTDETRLFLVPLAMVFIPASVAMVVHPREKECTSASIFAPNTSVHTPKVAVTSRETDSMPISSEIAWSVLISQLTHSAP